MANLDSKMEMGLPQELLTFLRLAGEVAQAQGQSLYLVGGAVRDLLLGRPNLDFDLMVEGDAPRLARQLAKASGEKVLTHPRHRSLGHLQQQKGPVSQPPLRWS